MLVQLIGLAVRNTKSQFLDSKLVLSWLFELPSGECLADGDVGQCRLLALNEERRRDNDLSIIVSENLPIPKDIEFTRLVRFVDILKSPPESRMAVFVGQHMRNVLFQKPTSIGERGQQFRLSRRGGYTGECYRIRTTVGTLTAPRHVLGTLRGLDTTKV